jgi:hypothetical protein
MSAYSYGTRMTTSSCSLYYGGGFNSGLYCLYARANVHPPLLYSYCPAEQNGCAKPPFSKSLSSGRTL